jgi:hypothetical protein
VGLFALTATDLFRLLVAAAAAASTTNFCCSCLSAVRYVIQLSIAAPPSTLRSAAVALGVAVGAAPLVALVACVLAAIALLLPSASSTRCRPSAAPHAAVCRGCGCGGSVARGKFASRAFGCRCVAEWWSRAQAKSASLTRSASSTDAIGRPSTGPPSGAGADVSVRGSCCGVVLEEEEEEKVGVSLFLASDGNTPQPTALLLLPTVASLVAAAPLTVVVQEVLVVVDVSRRSLPRPAGWGVAAELVAAA